MTAVVDPDQFEKVILNLLSNAFKFTPRGGTVRVELEEDPASADPCAVLRVSDTGIGIPKEAQAPIFERFYQGRGQPESAAAGTGIGLSLVRELVELHGGRVDVESEPGEGSCFTVRVPVRFLEVGDETGGRRSTAVVVEPPAPARLDDAASAPGADPMDGAAAENGSAVEAAEGLDPRLTILVVDDNSEIRQYLARHLSAQYRVLEAADGKRGLELAREQVPDLVLSDVMMPGVSGDELCRAIKTDPDLEFVPVVLLTAKASQESRMHGFAVGADDYLTKPFSMTEVRARIDNLISTRQRLRDRVRNATIVSAGAPAEATSVEERFLQNVRSAILENLGDEDFGVEALAEAVGHSRAHLYRRLGALQDLSPAELIRLMRLERGAELLKSHAGTVSEVAYAVGFRSVSHFSSTFRDHYGVTPSRYARNAAGLSV